MAKNRVRGITVEIGGDTTKLDKALQGTNKNISTTASKLKDVEKLLKLDPKNVELLDQKQRLLAQSAEATAEKYAQLKQVAETSTVSNVAFEKWEKAQTSLQGQITKTANELANLEKEAKKLEGLGFQADSTSMIEVQQQAEAARDKLEGLKQSLSNTYEELGRPISIDQWDDLQRELSEAKTNADDAKDAFEGFSPALSRFTAEADEVAAKAGKIADATKGLSIAAGGALATLGGLAVKAGASADELNTLAKQTGFSTQTLQEWQYASDLVDVSVDDIVGAARKLKKNMESTSADVAEAWSKLGVSFRDADGFRDVEYVFNDVLMAMSQIPNETERDIVAMTLFGRSADQLAGIIDDGGSALRRFGQEAQEAGLILSQDALDAANDFNDELDELKAKASASFLSIGVTLADSLLPLLEELADSISVILGWVSQLDEGTLKFIATILTIVALISPIAGIISSIGGAISTVSRLGGLFSATAGNSVYATFLKWSLIIIAVVTAVALLIAMINVLIGKGDAMQSAMNSFGGAAGNMTGGLSGGTTPYRARQSNILDDYPHFATGGVFAPNNPMLGVLGDNKSEYEVAAPESVIEDSVLNAMSKAGLGGGQNVRVNIQFAGNLAQLGRVLQPLITVETARLGPSLAPR